MKNIELLKFCFFVYTLRRQGVKTCTACIRQGVIAIVILTSSRSERLNVFTSSRINSLAH
jgi:hypothetical protein